MSDDPKGKRRRYYVLSPKHKTTAVGYPGAVNPSSTSRNDDQPESSADIAYSKSPLDIKLADGGNHLHRGLSTRQVQMIAIAGEGTTPVLASVRSSGLISLVGHRNNRNGVVFGDIQVVGPRRTRQHFDRLFCRRLYCLCHASIARRDGHTVPHCRYAWFPFVAHPAY